MNIIETIQTLNRLIDKTKTKYEPIPFIVGVMRSGTTMLRLMLDSHPDLSILPETRFFPQIEPLIQLENITPEILSEFLINHYTWEDFQISPHELRNNLDNIKSFTLSKGLRCFYSMYADRFGKKRWGDKTPYYDQHMLDLQNIFPEAHFIHIIRDGRDVILSTRSCEWLELGKDIYEEAQSWMNRVKHTRALAKKCTKYIEVRYEDLVLKPDRILRQVCIFIDLPYNDEMKNYHKTAKDRLDEFATRYHPDGQVKLHRERRIAIHENTQNPPDKERIGRWRQGLTKKEQSIFHQVAGEFLNELGYEI